MKTNAPERIWIDPTTDLSKLSGHIDKDSVEYIRKDAFIDKACAYLDSATEVTVHIDAGGYPYIPQIELYDYDKDIPLAKKGDRYKVILIKEN